jgi:hypothetical protein
VNAVRLLGAARVAAQAGIDRGTVQRAIRSVTPTIPHRSTRTRITQAAARLAVSELIDRGLDGDALVELLTDRLASPPSAPASSAANLAAGIRAVGYWSFDPRLEVVVAASDRAPRDSAARSAWTARLGRRPVPLVLMIVTEDATEPAVVVGPGGDPPPITVFRLIKRFMGIHPLNRDSTRKTASVS